MNRRSAWPDTRKPISLVNGERDRVIVRPRLLCLYYAIVLIALGAVAEWGSIENMFVALRGGRALTLLLPSTVFIAVLGGPGLLLAGLVTLTIFLTARIIGDDQQVRKVCLLPWLNRACDRGKLRSIDARWVSWPNRGKNLTPWQYSFARWDGKPAFECDGDVWSHASIRRLARDLSLTVNEMTV